VQRAQTDLLDFLLGVEHAHEGRAEEVEHAAGFTGVVRGHEGEHGTNRFDTGDHERMVVVVQAVFDAVNHLEGFVLLLVLVGDEACNEV